MPHSQRPRVRRLPVSHRRVQHAGDISGRLGDNYLVKHHEILPAQEMPAPGHGNVTAGPGRDGLPGYRGVVQTAHASGAVEIETHHRRSRHRGLQPRTCGRCGHGTVHAIRRPLRRQTRPAGAAPLQLSCIQSFCVGQGRGVYLHRVHQCGAQHIAQPGHLRHARRQKARALFPLARTGIRQPARCGPRKIQRSILCLPPKAHRRRPAQDGGKLRLSRPGRWCCVAQGVHPVVGRRPRHHLPRSLSSGSLLHAPIRVVRRIQRRTQGGGLRHEIRRRQSKDEQTLPKAADGRNCGRRMHKRRVMPGSHLCSNKYLKSHGRWMDACGRMDSAPRREPH